MTRQKLLLLLMSFLILMVFSACESSRLVLDAHATQVVVTYSAQLTAEATDESKLVATREPTSTPRAKAQTNPLRASKLFELISPAVVFIETEAGSGSGLLTEGNYIVTNAHVVWPLQSVRVVLPDGTEYPDAPVIGWDLVGDLAVIGPVETDLTPVNFAEDSTLAIGSDIYLIGYPAEVEKFPQPTLARGVLSRIRRWERNQMTYYQVDAAATGGQSGGVMVSENGKVVGVSGFSFGSSTFVLVLSSDYIMPQIKALIENPSAVTLSERTIPTADKGQYRHEFTLQNHWEVQTYILNEPAETTVDITVDGDGDGVIYVSDVLGRYVAYGNDGLTGEETLTLETELGLPYFVEFYQLDDGASDFEIESSHKLIPYKDPDDGVSMTIDQIWVGNLDYVDDVDYFEIDLEKNEIIKVNVDSILIDPYITIRQAEADSALTVTDDDTGGGIFGANAELVYQAPEAGRYYLVVKDSYSGNYGGYFLSVEAATEADEPQSPPLSAESIESDYGLMTLYRSDSHPFSLQYPADWERSDSSVYCKQALECYMNQDNAILTLDETTYSSTDREISDLASYVDVELAAKETEISRFELNSRETHVTAQGVEVEIIDFTMLNLLQARQLYYLSDDKVGFSVAYIAGKSRFDGIAEVVDYSFDSFEVEGFEGETAVDELEVAVEADAAEERFESTVETVDAELSELYAQRAEAHQQSGQFDQALADLNQAIELDGDDADLYAQRAELHWLTRDSEAALADINQAIEQRPNRNEFYRLRAFIHVDLDEYGAALADAKDALQGQYRLLAEADLLSSRGYVYLKLNRYEEANLDFTFILNRDEDYPFALLGKGLAQAGLEQSKKAIELLEEGLTAFEAVETPEPHVADLLKLAEERLSELQAE